MQYKELHAKRPVMIGNGRVIYGVGEGDLVGRCTNQSGKSVELMVKDVLHVPELVRDLASVKQIKEDGGSVHFTTGGDYIRDRDGNKIPIKEEGRLNFLEVQMCGEESVFLTDNMLLHEKLGHPGRDKTYKYNKYLEKNGITGNRLKEEKDCHACIKGKSTRTRWNKTRASRCVKPLQIIHLDYSGKARVCSRRGAMCYGLAVDPYSLYTVALLSKSEGTGTELLKKFLIDVGTPEQVMSDNAKTFLSGSFVALCNKENIQRTTTVPYSSNQNSSAEVMIGVVNRLATVLLQQRRVPLKFWEDAVEAAVYTLNNTPRESRGGQVATELQFPGSRAKLSTLRVFGCLCYVFQRKESRLGGKFGQTSIEGMFLGYAPTQPGYKVLLKGATQVVVSRDVRFVESKCGIDFIEHRGEVLSSDDIGGVLEENFETPMSLFLERADNTNEQEDGLPVNVGLDRGECVNVESEVLPLSGQQVTQLELGNNLNHLPTREDTAEGISDETGQEHSAAPPVQVAVRRSERIRNRQLRLLPTQVSSPIGVSDEESETTEEGLAGAVAERDLDDLDCDPDEMELGQPGLMELVNLVTSIEEVKHRRDLRNPQSKSQALKSPLKLLWIDAITQI